MLPADLPLDGVPLIQHQLSPGRLLRQRAGPDNRKGNARAADHVLACQLVCQQAAQRLVQLHCWRLLLARTQMSPKLVKLLDRPGEL